MCDTLAVVGPGRTLFAKNSDRPVGEVQVVEPHATRSEGGRLATQYLEIDDPGAAALMASRPEWLWGLEHGVNEHRVAIGNEKIFSIDDPYEALPALIGMDLVRLGLERGRTASEAIDAMTSLLEEHGQGGVGDLSSNEPYWSSFLVADPRGGWILETSGSKWAAEPIEDGAAISNRISLPGFEAFRPSASPTGHADRRLEVTRACVATGAAALTPADLARTMRDHGGLPFPTTDMNPVTGEGVTVCMHIRGYQATAASMICDLSADPAVPLRAWVALGSPCVSVYVPVFPPDGAPEALAKPESWRRFDRLRERVEADPDLLAGIRAVLDPVEEELWTNADEAAPDPERRARFVATAWDRVEDALARL